MNKYNEEYYLLFPEPEQDEYDVNPDNNTSRRHYDSEELNYGQEPLCFSTETYDLSFATSNYEIFFPVGSIVVTKELKSLLENGIYGSKFYPAIVKGESKGIREDVWALNIYELLDCWDRDKSVASYPGGVKSLDGIDVVPSVKTFHLSSEILDNIPEKERLLFVMDNTDVTNIFVHQKFVDIFKKHNIQGTRFIKVSKYRFGMEFV
ncbi:imm11 family protein [Aliivibrio sifiae]|uniref:Immunity MXAN-0049 protein domain-containing protein n=1 Tax=Aliivibrio sifiae TaxID=566293 RepID=A0A2S7X8W2_9GAMM|nr:DUF1629 domain-containing protein [Aliivibrio sifiae]PQJ87575.1 hypothetical protein BTO23_15850 [Aliivibrio sifiae]GLR73184.1 hypothetical protein GCM10007855_00570 [Aliivibrio sifiae]